MGYRGRGRESGGKERENREKWDFRVLEERERDVGDVISGIR